MEMANVIKRAKEVKSFSFCNSMSGMLTNKRYLINIILPLAGIVIAVLYNMCGGSCVYLQGTILGSNLDYLGMFYMGVLTLSNLLKRGLIFLFLLSFGLGAELYLIGFQITNSIFCFYCLSFGAVIFLLFLLNFEKSKKIFITISVVFGLILFLVLFKGSVTPAYAEDILLPSFGNGQIKVRLYTDYFCGPCSALEPKLEPVLTDLVKKNIINITFIDTPVHAQTTLYAKYFLYIVNEKREFDYVLRARAILFKAAKEKTTENEKLEAFLKKKGIGFKSFDTKTTFGVFSNYLKEDKITATPTCIITNKGKKDRFTGLNIIKALESLK
jgi:thiol:disulfide interchange protein DsbA